MKLKISKLAHSEIEDAKEYYNLEQENLGNIFKKDVKNTIDNILKFPNLYPNVTTNMKRCVLHRFPYSIFYALKTDETIILSVAHQHRKPFY